MNDPVETSLARRVPGGTVAAVALGVWVVVALARVAFPYDLEWMEGGMLQHVDRVRGGQPVFGPPTLEFAPFPYTPLYLWFAAPFSALAPDSFVPLRLVSIVASLLTFALVASVAARVVRAAGGALPLFAGLLAAGAYAAANRFTGAFGDIARVDALAWALALSAFVTARRAAHVQLAMAAGLLAALAFLTKQSTALFLLAAAAPLAVTRIRLAVTYLASAVLPVVGTYAVVDRATDGWFRFWTLDLLRGAPIHGPAVLGYWSEVVLALGALVAVVGAAVLVRVWRPPVASLVLPVVALVVTGYVGRLHVGGYDNNLIPTALGAALLFGPAAALLVERRRGWVAPAAVAAALLPLAYDPRDLVPGEEQRFAGDGIVDALGELGRPLFVPDHSHLVQRALGPNVKGSAHGMVWIDLLQSEQATVAQEFSAALESALAARRYRAVVTSERWVDPPRGLVANYAPPVLLVPDEVGAAATPVTGAPRRPTWVYRARE